MSSSCFIARFFLYLCRIIENIVIMTKANKVLFITQEITPYVPESEMSLVGRNLPQAIQEKGREIRTFMPKWGNINERRNQLHEVIRLSGMNLIIDDTYHPRQVTQTALLKSFSHLLNMTIMLAESASAELREVQLR